MSAEASKEASANQAPSPSRPLAGVRVLELARILAGPWAGQLLADLGADVVKVERPGVGDDTRHWGPPFVEAADGAAPLSSYFQSTNRGKRSIAIALETTEGQAQVRALAGHADVLIENFKVGGLARYGLDYASLSAHYPKLVYCSVTGFGQTGPYAHRAGYDFLVQGMSGAMALTGEPDGEPMKTAVAYADVFTGLYASNAILAALLGRERTGRGCHLDLALLDTQVAVLGNQAQHYLVSGESPPRIGNAHTAIVPYQVFAVADGHVVIACGNDGQFRRLCGVLGTGWCDEARYATNPQRVVHRAVLVPAMAAVLSGWTRDALLRGLERTGVPAGPINTLPDVFADPQVRHRGLVVALADPAARTGSAEALRTPIVIDGIAAVARTAAPALDADAMAILGDPGWSGADS